ncbi:MAG TPA: 1,4-dihydroxy-2-naphthoate octaprenyltransferase [Thermomicrobiales bacterium]|nr:1,4-dihydroxy-2-naphthoate octaprenyltransferase [Thermomicrobiales bacterium]
MNATDPTTAGLTVPPQTTPSRWRIWFQAIRFFSFTASAIPILIGASLALVDREFDLLLFVVMLAASVACHAGANLANDYFDHVKGIDTEESLGPSKVIQQSLLTPAEVRRGMIVAFAIATALGLFIVAETGWPILALALASLGAAYFYTGGPKPLGYIALGEVTVLIFMGPVMIGGAYYVLAERLTWEVILASLPIGFLVAAILHANNIRDIELDRAAGKVTLATLLGRHWANIEYLALVAGAFVATAVLIVAEPRLWPVAVVVLSAPTAVWLIRLVFSAAEGRSLNVALRKTAGLHLRFGLLMTAGLLIRATIDRL